MRPGIHSMGTCSASTSAEGDGCNGHEPMDMMRDNVLVVGFSDELGRPDSIEETTRSVYLFAAGQVRLHTCCNRKPIGCGAPRSWRTVGDPEPKGHLE